MVTVESESICRQMLYIIRVLPLVVLRANFDYVIFASLCCLLATTTYASPRSQETAQHPSQQHMMFEHSEPVQQNHKCREWEWMCEDGIECIAQYDVCDGVSQCADQSDERNCINRFAAENYHLGQDRQQEPPGPLQPHRGIDGYRSSTPLPSPLTHHDDAKSEEINMKYLFGGMAIFVFVAFVTHTLLKRRRRRLGEGGHHRNGFRKGESLVDDEDDLLISQMYN